MKRLLFNAEQRLRQGWWVLIFLVLLVGFGFVQVGLHWVRKTAQIPAGPWTQLFGTLAILGATWTVLRLRQEPFGSVGLLLDRRWFQAFAWGTALGLAQMLAAALLVWGLGGVRWELDPTRSLWSLGSGGLVFLFVAVKEETLFRGFLFQRLRDGLGLWPTQFLLAALFALAHWGNPGMQGMTKVWATLDIALGALVFGMAYVRTGSLALPIGIHLGWNWMQGQVLGFGVSGMATHGWLHPVLQGKPQWLTGGAFGLEASVFAVLVDAVLLCALLAWKGSLPKAPSGAVPEIV